MQPKTYDVVGMGRAFTDVVRRVDDSFLAEHRLVKGQSPYTSVADLTRIQDHLAGYRLIPGGPIGNTIAGVAALGGRAAFLGATADDNNGAAFRAAFRRDGVTFPSEPVTGRNAISPTCLVLVTQDGERTMPYSRGVGDRIPLDGIVDTVARSRVLYIQGHLLFSDEAQAPLQLALETARRYDTRVAITLHALHLDEEQRLALPEKLAPADLILASRSEVEDLFPLTMTGRNLPSRPTIVMTDGPSGAHARMDLAWRHVPAEFVPGKLDTTGAGDQLAAGTLIGYARGWPMLDSVRLGTQAASAILTIPGGRPDRNLSHLTQAIADRIDSRVAYIPPVIAPAAAYAE